jgi:hypothetical protein
MESRARVGGKAWRGEDSPSGNGRRSAPMSPRQRLPREGGARAWMVGGVWRAPRGSCGLAPRGVRGPGGTAAPARAGGGSNRGESRGAPQAVAGLLGPARWPAGTALGRMLCGWELPGGERGAQVGKTRQGEGTKWLVLVDGAGPPWGACLDAASPAEVTLLQKTPDTALRGMLSSCSSRVPCSLYARS